MIADRSACPSFAPMLCRLIGILRQIIDLKCIPLIAPKVLRCHLDDILVSTINHANAMVGQTHSLEMYGAVAACTA